MKISKHKSFHDEEYFYSDHYRSNLRKHAVKGGGATIISTFSTFLIQTIGAIILARLLQPGDFGLVAMVASIYTFFRVLRNFGLTDATIQEKEINHKKISTLFWVNVAFSILNTAVFMALGPLISWFYNDPRLTPIAILFSLELFFGGLATQHRALLKRNFQFYKDAAIEIPAVVIGFGTAIYLAWTGWGYWAIVMRWVAYAIVEVIGAWMFCRWRPGLPAFGTGVLPMVKFGMNMVGNFSVSALSRNLDKILIGWRYGNLSLGYYDRAFALFMLPAQRMSEPLTHVAVATLSKLREDPEKYRHYYLNAVSTIAFIGFPISAVLTVMSSDVILLLLGPQWEKASKILSVFGIAIGVQMINTTNAWIHISLGRSDRWFRWSIIGAICTSISYFIGLSFGALGVAISYTICLYLLIGPCLWYAVKPISSLKFRSIISVIWRYYLSAFFVGLLYYYMLHSFNITSKYLLSLKIYERLILSIFFYFIAYVIIVMVLFGNTKQIRQFISIGIDMVPGFKLKK